MITLRQLRYLDALAETLHFGEAAEACAVSQPALSMQIRELEEVLEVSLVERRKSGVELTEQGRPARAHHPRCATCSITPSTGSGCCRGRSSSRSSRRSHPIYCSDALPQ